MAAGQDQRHVDLVGGRVWDTERAGGHGRIPVRGDQRVCVARGGTVTTADALDGEAHEFRWKQVLDIVVVVETQGRIQGEPTVCVEPMAHNVDLRYSNGFLSSESGL